MDTDIKCMTNKEKAIKELKEALDGLDITNNISS